MKMFKGVLPFKYFIFLFVTQNFMMNSECCIVEIKVIKVLKLYPH